LNSTANEVSCLEIQLEIETRSLKMDPNATLALFLAHAHSNDFSGAFMYAEALADWLNNGGFEPLWSTGWSREVFFIWYDAARLNEACESN
jgi:hypothetical protein